MISNVTKRSIVRWIHLIFTIPILGYIYGEASEVQQYAGAVRFVFVPVLILSGYWMYAGVFFAIIGAGCISADWIRDGYPESGRAIHRAQDLVGDSCATVEKIGLIGVDFSNDRQRKKPECR